MPLRTSRAWLFASRLIVGKRLAKHIQLRSQVGGQHLPAGRTFANRAVDDAAEDAGPSVAFGDLTQ